MDGTPCRKCGTIPDSSGPITLWDGRGYCRACVESAAPGLAEFAAEHPVFEDAIPYDRAGAMREVYTLMAFFGFGIATVAAILAVASGAGTMSIPISAGGAVFFAGLLYIPLLVQVNSGPRRLPKVRIGGGGVEVFREAIGPGKLPTSRYPLAECTWHLGLLREDSAAQGRGGVIVARTPAVILKAPRMPLFPYSATGSTPEIRERLVGFLRLAGIAEGR